MVQSGLVTNVISSSGSKLSANIALLPATYDPCSTVQRSQIVESTTRLRNDMAASACLVSKQLHSCVCQGTSLCGHALCSHWYVQTCMTGAASISQLTCNPQNSTALMMHYIRCALAHQSNLAREVALGLATAGCAHSSLASSTTLQTLRGQPTGLFSSFLSAICFRHYSGPYELMAL